MGWFYTLGINFNDRELAEVCNQKIMNFEIKLSDNTIVEIATYIYEEKLIDGISRYQSQILPKGLEYGLGNRKLLSKPYFYEIRNKIYSFLIELDIEFNYAFYEFEGADTFLDENIIEYLNEVGIGEVKKDINASSMLSFDDDYYLPKRYFDGLIISEKLFNLLENKSNFEVFKEKYMWLPLNE
jgi:hypothetical protein